jgi:NAD(P)-dependent dehydrogenase (short-subunit alcohol dehydrogenase family)
MELARCAALVTGGVSGIGAAIAADLEVAGARVVIADRAGSPIVGDLSRPGDARRMVVEAVEQLAGLDVLVNNAGGYSGATFPTNDDWRSPLELNLLSAMEAIKYALPALAKRPGCVVNVASSAALGGDRYPGVEYAVAKAGLIRLTCAGQRRLSAHGGDRRSASLAQNAHSRRNRSASPDASRPRGSSRRCPAAHRGRFTLRSRDGTDGRREPPIPA